MSQDISYLSLSLLCMSLQRAAYLNIFTATLTCIFSFSNVACLILLLVYYYLIYICKAMFEVTNYVDGTPFTNIV